MKIPENCPLKGRATVPISCPCYNLQDCKLKMEEKKEVETKHAM